MAAAPVLSSDGRDTYQTPATLPGVALRRTSTSSNPGEYINTRSPPLKAVDTYAALDGSHLSHDAIIYAASSPSPPSSNALGGSKNAPQSTYDAVELPTTASRPKAPSTYDEVEAPLRAQPSAYDNVEVPLRVRLATRQDASPYAQPDGTQIRGDEPTHYADPDAPPARLSFAERKSFEFTSRNSTHFPFPQPPPRPSMSAGSSGFNNRRSSTGSGSRTYEATVDLTITKERADEMLMRAGMLDGFFVLRESRSHAGSFVLCVVEAGQSRHYPVERNDDPFGYRLLSPEPPHFFPTLDGVIEYYSNNLEGLTVRLRRRIT